MQTIACVGLAAWDVHLSVGDLPGVAGIHHAGTVAERLGGRAANAAMAVAALEGSAWFCGRLGDDPRGDRIVAALEAADVNTNRVARIRRAESPASVILTSDAGERVTVVHRDRLLVRGEAGVGEVELTGADVVLTDLEWVSGARAGLETARRLGIPGALHVDSPAGDAEQLLETATHVVFTATGLAELTATSDPAHGLKRARVGVDAWAAVLSTAGVHWTDADRIRHVPAAGPGDASAAPGVFYGALGLALAESRAPEEAVRFAQAAAATGAADSSPSVRAAVERALDL